MNTDAKEKSLLKVFYRRQRQKISDAITQKKRSNHIMGNDSIAHQNSSDASQKSISLNHETEEVVYQKSKPPAAIAEKPVFCDYER